MDNAQRTNGRDFAVLRLETFGYGAITSALRLPGSNPDASELGSWAGAGRGTPHCPPQNHKLGLESARNTSLGRSQARSNSFASSTNDTDHEAHFEMSHGQFECQARDIFGRRPIDPPSRRYARCRARRRDGKDMRRQALDECVKLRCPECAVGFPPLLTFAAPLSPHPLIRHIPSWAVLARWTLCRSAFAASRRLL